MMTRYTAQGRKGCHATPGVTPSMPSLELDSLQHLRQQETETPSGSVSWRERGKPARRGQSLPASCCPSLEGFSPSDPGPLLSTSTPPKSPHWETPAARELIASDPLSHGIAMTGTEMLIHRGEQTGPASEPCKALSRAHRGPAYPRRCPQVFHEEADILTRASASLGSPWKRRWGHGPARLGELTYSEAHPRTQPSSRPPGSPPPAGCRG